MHMFYPPVPKEPITDDEVTPDMGLEETGTPNTVTCPECYNNKEKRPTCDTCKGYGRLKKLSETRTERGVHTTYGVG